MRHILTAALLLTAAPLAAAAIPADADATIDKANAAWLSAMTAHDATPIAEPYADDAVFTFADGHSLQGAPAIRAFFEQRMTKLGAVTGGELVSDGRAMDDGLIIEWGHGRLSVRSSDGKVSTPPPGAYLTVWKQQADGRWRIIRNLVF